MTTDNGTPMGMEISETHFTVGKDDSRRTISISRHTGRYRTRYKDEEMYIVESGFCKTLEDKKF